jgi:hypothetical protein
MKVIDPATLAGTRVHARYCEGAHCYDPDGEVRAYPILFNVRCAHVILCRPCWEHQNRHRRQRGKELGCPEHWPTRDWDEAERYPERALEEPAAPPQPQIRWRQAA